MTFLWGRVYGLGLAFEVITIASDNLMWVQRTATCKLFLGPLVVLFCCPVQRRKPFNSP